MRRSTPTIAIVGSRLALVPRRVWRRRWGLRVVVRWRGCVVSGGRRRRRGEQRRCRCQHRAREYDTDHDPVQLDTMDAPPDADATAGAVQTAVALRALAAAVSSGEANEKAFNELFDSWNGYHETIKASDPADWQTMNDARSTR